MHHYSDRQETSWLQCLFGWLYPCGFCILSNKHMFEFWKKVSVSKCDSLITFFPKILYKIVLVEDINDSYLRRLLKYQKKKKKIWFLIQNGHWMRFNSMSKPKGIIPCVQRSRICIKLHYTLCYVESCQCIIYYNYVEACQYKIYYNNRIKCIFFNFSIFPSKYLDHIQMNLYPIVRKVQNFEL